MRSTIETAYILWSLLVLIGCKQGVEKVASSQSTGQLKGFIVLDDQVYSAGDKITVHMNLNHGNGCLLVTTTFHEEWMCFNKLADPHVLELPGKLSRDAGMIQLSLYASQKLLDKRLIRIEALGPAGKLDGYLGPKTIDVDRGEAAQLIVIPTDLYHNLCEDEIPVDIVVTDPDNRQSTQSLLSRAGVAVTDFKPVRTAGTRFIGARSGASGMRQKVVTYTPGTPANIYISLTNHYPLAGTQHLFKVVTDPVYDAHENLVADGTHLEFYMEDTYSRRSNYKATIVSGIAEVIMSNPVLPGQYEVWAQSAGGVVSNRVAINLESDIDDFPVVYDRVDQLLIIGPVISKLGSLVADGTDVLIVYGPEESQKAKNLTLVNGVATSEILLWPDFDESGMCEVTISSVQKRLVW